MLVMTIPDISFLRDLSVSVVKPLLMKIDAITLRELNMPLVHFFETSFGRTYTSARHARHGAQRWPRRLGRVRCRRATVLQRGVHRRRMGCDRPLSRTVAAREDDCVGHGSSGIASARCASIAWPRLRWKTRSGMPRRRRKAFRYGSCWEAVAARLLVASASAFRIHTSSCCRRLKLSWPPAISASR